MPKQRLVIELYDHTQNEEILDIMNDLKNIGLDDFHLERQVSAATKNSTRKVASLSHEDMRKAVSIAAQLEQ